MKGEKALESIMPSAACLITSREAPRHHQRWYPSNELQDSETCMAPVIGIQQF
jgi:hypothetical protein